MAQTVHFISAPASIKTTINSTAVQNKNLIAHKGVLTQKWNMDHLQETLRRTLYL